MYIDDGQPYHTSKGNYEYRFGKYYSLLKLLLISKSVYVHSNCNELTCPWQLHAYLSVFEKYEEALTIGISQHGFQKVEIRSLDWYRALDLTCASQNLSWKKVQTNSVYPNCVKLQLYMYV